MVWLISFLLILLLLAAYFFFAPFFIDINTDTGLFRIRFHRWISAQLTVKYDLFSIELKILWWHRVINLFGGRNKRQSARDKKTTNADSSITVKKTSSLSPKKIQAMIMSFKIKKFYLTIDTGNMQINGIMFPAFRWLSTFTRKHFSINFSGRNIFILRLENNFARILRAYLINHQTFKKKYHEQSK